MFSDTKAFISFMYTSSCHQVPRAQPWILNPKLLYCFDFAIVWFGNILVEVRFQPIFWLQLLGGDGLVSFETSPSFLGVFLIHPTGAQPSQWQRLHGNVWPSPSWPWAQFAWWLGPVLAQHFSRHKSSSQVQEDWHAKRCELVTVSQPQRVQGSRGLRVSGRKTGGTLSEVKRQCLRNKHSWANCCTKKSCLHVPEKK